jgi:hypothetical protein
MMMTAFDAKHAGDEANAVMKKLNIDWVTFKGKKMPYHENAKGDFYNVIVAAEWAKVNQNPPVKEILKKTGTLILKPDHHPEANEAPAWKYYEIWTEIRSQL